MESVWVITLTSDHDTCIYGLSFDHLLRIHTHQVPQEHASGRGERLVQADGRELDWESTVQLYASLHRFHQLRHVGVARIEPGVRVDDAYYGP